MLVLTSCGGSAVAVAVADAVAVAAFGRRGEQQGALTGCGAAQLQAQMQLQMRLRHLGVVEEQQGGGDVRGEGGCAPGPDAGADAGFI